MTFISFSVWPTGNRQSLHAPTKMRSMLHYSLLLAVAWSLLILGRSRLCADVGPEAIQKARQATVLVQVRQADGVSEGSAFCIDASGIFVTNAHVVADLEANGNLTLIIHSGHTNQTMTPGHVVDVDRDADLAILQAESPIDIIPLDLGKTDTLFETMAAAAFGHPAVTIQAEKTRDYPETIMSLGQITALKKFQGDLRSIQLDGSINPGDSGGPVIDGKGEVIGIVHEPMPRTKIRSAIPATLLRRLLLHTRMAFTPPPLRAGHLYEPQEFLCKFLTAPVGDVTIDMTLTSGPTDVRTYHAEAVDAKTFRATAPLLPPKDAGTRIHVTLKIKNSLSQIFQGEISDRKVTVAGMTVPLSSIRRITNRREQQVVLADGGIVTGKITGISDIETDLNGHHTVLDLTEYDSVTLTPLPVPEMVTYLIEERQGGKVTATIEGRIHLNETARLPDPTAISARSANANRNAGILYDGFNYRVGEPLENRQVGSGRWGGTVKKQPTGSIIVEGNLKFGNLLSSGNSVMLTGNHPINYDHKFQIPRDKSDAALFLSFLIKPLNLQAGSRFELRFGGIAIGKGVHSRYYGLEAVGDHTRADSKVPISIQTAFLVARITSRSGKETVELFVNPEPGRPLSKTPDAVKQIADTGTPQALSLGSSQLCTFDEIRIGRTFEEVAPVR